MRKLFILLALVTFSLGVGKGLYLLKDGFTCRRIHCLETDISAVFDEESIQALAQTFHYIGRGRQCFAFASADNKYVLKIPRTDIYQPPFWVRVLPVYSHRKWLEKDQLERKEFLLNSFQIAFEELKDQTGTIALHLGKSKPEGKKLTLVDATGSTHHLRLDQTPFALQYKKPILIKTFLSLLEKDEIEAIKVLNALLETIAERAQKGVLNRDRSFLRNYGYAEGKAFQIDIGSFFHQGGVSRASFEKSFKDSTDPIREWLALKAPQILPHLDQQIDASLSKSTN